MGVWVYGCVGVVGGASTDRPESLLPLAVFEQLNRLRDATSARLGPPGGLDPPNVVSSIEGRERLEEGFGFRFRVEGSGAAAYLDRMICGALPRVGRVTLAYALTASSRLLSEFTISRLAADSFYLLAAASARQHDWDLLSQHLPADGSVRIEDASEMGSTLVIAGPRSRHVLAALTNADLSNDAFPWLSARPIEVAGAAVLALRINYVGELGWELHVPIDRLCRVYEALCEAGRAHGIGDFGMYAMDSLRLEKGYVSWKQDITLDYDPFEAGLERFVRLEKGDFTGRAALAARKARGTMQRFVPLIVDADDADALPSSIVFHGDECDGVVGSGGFGHRIGRSIALAYVRSDLAVPGTTLDIGILGTRYPATVATSPLYDPANARLRL